MRLSFWGRYSPLVLGLAGLSFVADQAHKWWMLNVYGMEGRGTVPVTPFLDLVMVWNKGVSYGLFETHMQGVLVALSLVISAFLWRWAARTSRVLAAAALGLVIGGALANALDRALRGAVADFFHIHWGSFSWYVFNLADIAIVAGVALLLYDSLREGRTP